MAGKTMARRGHPLVQRMHHGVAMRTSLAVAVAILVTIGVGAVAAQELNIEAPPPTRESRPPEPSSEPRPGDERDDSRGIPNVPYDPFFVPPLTTDVPTGPMGIAVWTAPNANVAGEAAGARENSGWLGFGFTWTWGGPPVPYRPGGRPAS
jgi:hypothetical protein